MNGRSIHYGSAISILFPCLPIRERGMLLKLHAQHYLNYSAIYPNTFSQTTQRLPTLSTGMANVAVNCNIHFWPYL